MTERRLVCRRASLRKSPSSAPPGHLLPTSWGEGKWGRSPSFCLPTAWGEGNGGGALPSVSSAERWAVRVGGSVGSDFHSGLRADLALAGRSFGWREGADTAEELAEYCHFLAGGRRLARA